MILCMYIILSFQNGYREAKRLLQTIRFKTKDTRVREGIRPHDRKLRKYLSLKLDFEYLKLYLSDRT